MTNSPVPSPGSGPPPGPLPHGWTDALHVLEPSPLDDARAWLVRALIVLALLAAWLWWRRRRRRGSLAEPAPPPAAVATTDAPMGFVEELRRRFDGTGRYREGCHELALALRTHWSAQSNWPLVSRTAREIADVVRDREVVGLFERLAQLQYRRHPPGRGDFLAACDQATAAVGEGRPSRAPGATGEGR